MCIDCLEDYDARSALPPTLLMKITVELVKDLYRQPNCGAGGPLHCVVDDYNVEDQHLSIFECEMTEETRGICGAIVENLKLMTVPQRAATIGLAWGDFE